jgi:hypothetical protein
MFSIGKFLSDRRKARPIPLFTNVKYTAKVVSDWLEANGWTLIAPGRDLYVHASFVARKGAIVLAIRCSGTDYRLLSTSIKDLRTAALQHAYHPIYVYGEQKDPRWWQMAREGTDIILSVHDIDELEARVLSSSPMLVGSAEVRRFGFVQGWIRLSPTGQATLNAYLGEECIGTCVADLPRKGPGEFRFKLTINKAISPTDIQDRVVIKAFRDEQYISLIPIVKEPIV